MNEQMFACHSLVQGVSDTMEQSGTASFQGTPIQVGVSFGPTGDWDGIVSATRLAEERGLDTVGFWDHYHAEQPEWELICGWTAYGYLAAVTERIRLVPMVICHPNHLLGVLAKESSLLQIASGGRFELGIGAGDYPVEFTAWNVPFPDAAERIAWLEESVTALRALWTGQQVTASGRHVQLEKACCTPAPPVPPRVVVGAGGSRRLIESAVAYADEINVYDDPAVVTHAAERIAATGRDVSLSIFGGRPGGDLPADLAGEIARWRAVGASRYVMTLGWTDDLAAGIERLAEAKATAHRR